MRPQFDPQHHKNKTKLKKKKISDDLLLEKTQEGEPGLSSDCHNNTVTYL
jgi:hypothetical protein